MALTRRSVQRIDGRIWPGFVDVVTALLMVMMFVLTIFMVVQYVLREQISGQESALEQLNAEINILAEALGLPPSRSRSPRFWPNATRRWPRAWRCPRNATA